MALLGLLGEHRAAQLAQQRGPPFEPRPQPQPAACRRREQVPVYARLTAQSEHLIGTARPPPPCHRWVVLSQSDLITDKRLT